MAKFSNLSNRHACEPKIVSDLKNDELGKKVDFRKFVDPIRDLALKRVSKFVIPEFRDTLLVPKITKCGDLLYYKLL